MMRVRVPGTTANLGPGFDCMGLALSVYGNFRFEEREEGLVFENVAPEFQNEENLAVVAYRRTLQEIGVEAKGLFLSIQSDIPVCSGLGSSASLIVAGVVAANAMHGCPLTEQDMLNLVTELEGHPDNVAPALLGGLTASIVNHRNVYSMRCMISPEVKACAMIPNFSLSTKEARAALPKTLDFKDAVFNVSRASVLLRALEIGDFAAIRAAMDDKLHQPYRANLIPEYENMRSLALVNGAISFCISGAGPTLLAIYRDDNFPLKMEEAVKNLRGQWRILPLSVDRQGAIAMEDRA